MKITRDEIIKSYKQLDSSNKQQADQVTEEIFKIIIDTIDNYNGRELKWERPQAKISEIFFEGLTNVYKNTSERIHDIYINVKEFDIKDIYSITYHEDGKTTDERMESYWEKAEKALKEGKSQQEVKCQLEYDFGSLIKTETSIIENTVKKNKVPLIAWKAVVTSGECGCLCPGGEYGMNEVFDPPPYHKNCGCSFWVEPVDDIIEIEELGLEVEEVGQVDIEVVE